MSQPAQRKQRSRTDARKGLARATGSAWACLWRSRNALDGERSHLVCENCVPVLYPTRQLMRNYIVHKFGYIARRKDLKAEPHGWRMPVPVRVTISPNNKLSNSDPK